MAHAKPESSAGAKGAEKAQSTASTTAPAPASLHAPAPVSAPAPTQTQLPPRAALTHNSQEDMTATAIVMPPPLPLDFETSPDAIALQNAMAILQMQRRRAEADIVALQRAKNEALANPEAFLRDLQSGAVQMAGGIMPGEKRNTGEIIPSYSDSDTSESDVEMNSANNTNDTSNTKASANNDNAGEGSSAQLLAAARAGKKKVKIPKPSWTKLPSEQNIVRCPPINWAQYAVVGESLDKLHAEQVKRPNGGVPAFFTQNGTYEFRAGGGAGSGGPAATATGPGETYLGVAAPYVPGRDVLPDKRRTGSVATNSGGRKNAKGPGRPARK
ncbi:hypothetical protein TD95_000870 [Thielaviopsis punctulata]|uniref:Uncharacterized protein n=1 Tax=Thielaviopsis punctulata TaxID=72032 RepID=A0A0F4Z8A7_9PEZI|nr:hypothetical protein TD95_000870 [Thielaviopsis punctulata]